MAVHLHFPSRQEPLTEMSLTFSASLRHAMAEVDPLPRSGFHVFRHAHTNLHARARNPLLPCARPTFMGAYPGIPTAEAAQSIRAGWARFRSLPEPPPHDPRARTISIGRILSDPKVVGRTLRQGIRDHGWCVFHATGDAGLHELHDAVIEGMDWDAEGHDLSRMIDFAFSGIGIWRA